MASEASETSEAFASRLQWAVLGFGLAAFLCLSAWQLGLPGLHYDEAREAGLPALQLLRGLPVDAFRGAGIRLGPTLLPLMVVDYIGATNVFLALPALALGGASVVALRAVPVALSALSLLLLYAVARRVYGPRAAAVAFLLLAVNPSFVFWSRQGIFVTSTIVPIGLGAAYCLLRFGTGGRRGWLAGGAFLLGLGLYTKFIFLWWIAGLGVAAVALPGGRAAIRRVLPLHASLVDLSAAAAAFLAGISPLILYNVQTGGTWGAIGKNLATSYYGTNNLAFLQNLTTRLDQLGAVLSGGHLWYLGGVFENRLWWYLGGALAILGVVAAIRARCGAGRLAFPYLAGALILVASCFTVSALWPTHFALLTPLPPLALAASAAAIWSTPGRRRATAGVALALVAGVWLGDVYVDLQYHGALARTGGLGGHSSAVYALARGLDEAHLAAPAAIDWGIAAPVEFLTEGRVRPIELFGYDWDDNAGFRERLAPFLDNPDMLYVFHTPSETVFPRLDAFNDLLLDRGKRSRTERVIQQPDGKPIFTLVRVIGAGNKP